MAFIFFEISSQSINAIALIQRLFYSMRRKHTFIKIVFVLPPEGKGKELSRFTDL